MVDNNDSRVACDINRPWLDQGDVVVHHGDCRFVMTEMPDASVDAIVTDPPYGLDFMGREWDRPGEMVGTARGISGGFQRFPPGVKRPEYAKSDPHAFQRWAESWAVEALRVLKPGGHLIAFGGTRMYHRLACGIEDAGFELRDLIAWLYGQGFPKSVDVSKAIDKAAGAEREVVGTRTKRGLGGSHVLAQDSWTQAQVGPIELEITKPATLEAEEWDGFGTALKPAIEPCAFARKPLEGTIVGNVLEHGTGAINIDACRVAYIDADDLAAAQAKNPGRDGELVTSNVYGADRPQQRVNEAGRHPANVMLDEYAAALLDSDARFFFVAKPTAEEKGATNLHETVKPIALMRELVRLVVPPGGLVLDPFAGSGTTLLAARREGFRAIGIEMTEKYLPMIADRLNDEPVTLFGATA